MFQPSVCPHCEKLLRPCELCLAYAVDLLRTIRGTHWIPEEPVRELGRRPLIY